MIVSSRRLSAIVVALSAPLVSAVAQTLEDGLDFDGGSGFTTSARNFILDEYYPAGEWAFETTTTHDGVDSASSTLPEGAFSRVDLEVEGPAVVSFWWKVSGEQIDDLGFAVNGTQRLTISPGSSGEVDWSHRTLELECGTNVLTWFFERYGNDTGTAWLDEVVVTPIPNNPDLQNGLDTDTHEIFSQDWERMLDGDAVDGDLAQTPALADGASSTLLLEVEGPAVVEFEWGIDGDEVSYSSLSLSLDGSFEDEIRPTNAMTEKRLELGLGTHCLRFRYYQDYDNPEFPFTGTKAAYLDNLRITPIPESAALATAIERTGGVYSNTWTLQTYDAKVGSSAARARAPEPDKAELIFIDLPEEAGLLSLWYKTDAEVDKGYLVIRVDGRTITQATGDVDWTNRQVNLGPSSDDRVLEAFIYRREGSFPATEVFLDEVKFLPGETNYRPDLTIKTKGSKTKGQDRYSRTGSGQAVKVTTDDFRPFGIYTVSCHNDCPTDDDTLTLRGTKSNRHFESYFLVHVGNKRYNYSAAFQTGRFVTGQLAPGEEERYEIQIGRNRKSKKKSWDVILRATSQNDPSKTDAVKASIKIKKIRRPRP